MAKPSGTPTFSQPKVKVSCSWTKRTRRHNRHKAAAYQLVLDRQLGDYKLPDGWAVVLAGNLLTDKAIVNQMSSALKNRFWFICT